MELKTMFENRTSMWVRYSDYEIKKDAQGENYIVPCTNTAFTVYDPADISIDLVCDALNAGQVLRKYDDDETTHKTVIAFAKKYGLLGWITALPMDKDFLSEDETYLGKNNFYFSTQSKLIPTVDYLRTFYPFYDGEIIYNEPKIAQVIGRKDYYESVFSRSYAEPMLWTTDLLYRLYDHFESAINLNNPDYSAEDLEFMRRETEKFDYQGIDFRMVAGTRPEMKWEFDSLKALLETAYCMYVTDGGKPLRMCKHCGKAYYNKNQRSEFCSPKCRNQWNVYKSRNKNKKSDE